MIISGCAEKLKNNLISKCKAEVKKTQNILHTTL